MSALSVLIIHNRYQQPGGEDTVVRADASLLRRAGHRVIEYVRDNSELSGLGLADKARLLFDTSWNARSYGDIKQIIRVHRPDVAHCHNFLPLVSPAAYYACKRSGVPVVQTLHNYRLICPAGTLFRRGQRCDCCNRHPIRSIARGCYRNSKLQTAAVSLMNNAHRLTGTWQQKVDAYITPSRFCRDLFVRAGLPPEKIFHRANLLESDPPRRNEPGRYALFVGRLSEEKGVLPMLRTWRELRHVPLHIVGDGPLRPDTTTLISSLGLNANVFGQLSPDETLAQIRNARFLVFPSQWDEPFGMVLLEAAACGVPAIASRVGAVPEIVEHLRTGLLFDPENFEELVDGVRWAWSHPAQIAEMGDQAHQRYREQFSAEQSYEALINVYRLVAHNH